MKIEKYGLFEVTIDDVNCSGPVGGCAVFRSSNTELSVPAFMYAPGHGDGTAGYKVRFMPQMTGTWTYHISLGGRDLDGTFACVENTGNNHGPVKAVGDQFCYADGECYVPVGTTCYAWIHQTEELQQQTLATLAQAPFNKIRMCVFPKSMPYNNNDPEVYPFERRDDGSWDISRPVPEFWDKLDLRLTQLLALGIEADLILFHPYDRWGFGELSQADSLAYVEYCLARLGAYRNIWWSLANEYETLYAKTMEDWDACGALVKSGDIYGHLLSIHNMIAPYPRRDWMTHCSIQAKEVDRILAWKRAYAGLPVIIDECGYEGDLPFEWGNLSAFEMVHRFWWTLCRGGFCTHGETFHRDDEVLWWSKGGKLYGESAPRIAFMKALMYRLPGPWHCPEPKPADPNQMDEAQAQRARCFHRILTAAPAADREIFMAHGCPMQIEGQGFFMEYFGHMCPAFTELKLDDHKRYRIEVIDIWEMTRRLVSEGPGGQVKIGLPGKEGIVILAMEV